MGTRFGAARFKAAVDWRSRQGWRLAQSALGVIDTALQYYPDERTLLEWRDVLTERIPWIRVSKLIEEAEKEAFKSNYGGSLESISRCSLLSRP